MARAQRPSRYWRCARCQSPTPIAYRHCGVCGHDRNMPPPRQWTDAERDEFIENAKRIFPGSH